MGNRITALRLSNKRTAALARCNALDVTFPICTPTLAVSGVKLYLFLGFGSLSPCVVFLFRASLIMSSRALHLHTCSSHAFEHFPRCPFCIPALRSPPVAISSFLSCVGIKHFRIGLRLAKRPWFTTGRPPVKFRTIWTSFDAPTINEGPRRPRVCCSPTPLQVGPKPTKTLPII